MRALTYHRASTRDQDPTLARATLQREARERGLDLVVEIEETGSGAKRDRPGLLRVMELAEGRRVDVVLVWKLDRFGRSCLDLLKNLERLDAAGVRLVAVSQGIDTGAADAAGKFTRTVLAAAAEYERSLIIERTTLGLADRRAQLEKNGQFWSRRSGKLRRGLGRPRVEIPPEVLTEAIQLRSHRRYSWAELERHFGGRFNMFTLRRAVLGEIQALRKRLTEVGAQLRENTSGGGEGHGG